MDFKYQSSPIDQGSVELLFVYIKKFRMFANTLVCLNSSYDVTLKSSRAKIFEIKRRDIKDPYRRHGVNLIVICGQNGVGKSTLMDILAGKHERERGEIIVGLIDKNGAIASNAKISICEGATTEHLPLVPAELLFDFEDSGHLHSEKKLNSHEFQRSFLDDYVNLVDLYKIDDSEIFSNFEIRCQDLEGLTRRIRDQINSLGSRIFEWSIGDLYWDSPLKFFFMKNCLDNTSIGELHDLAQRFNPDQSRSFINFAISKLFSGHLQEFKAVDLDLKRILFYKPEGAFKKKEPRSHHITAFSSVKCEILEIEKRIQKLFSRALSNRQIINASSISDSLEYFGFKQDENGNRRYLSDLSGGEFTLTRCKHNLSPLVRSRRAFWLHEDEPDNHLHPEWKRQFLSLYMDALKQVRNNTKKSSNPHRVLSIVLTTHSPFILSDVFSENVVVLEKNENCTKARRLTANPFAGNIGEMFYTNFFMSETIGELAKKEILGALKTIKGECNNDDGNSREYAEGVLSKIGDKILKGILIDGLGK